MFVLRLQEHPVPVGSEDPDVLLAWILDSMGLVRRRNYADGVDETRGSIHALMRDQLLRDPLRGWDSQEMIDVSDLGNNFRKKNFRRKKLSEKNSLTKIF